MFRRAGFVALAFFAAVSALAGEADCTGYGALADDPPLAVAHVAEASPRVPFAKNGSDLARCPDATPSCREKAFVVPGNRVIIGAVRGAFTCADYVGARGADRAGWLPSSALVREVEGPVAPTDWAGSWTREEAGITVARPGADGVLAIKGDATYGSLDPARVKRGAVNIGQIEARVAPRGARLSFAMAIDATLPVEKGGETDCKVWMRRLGPWLLVDDNDACGGMNVSFRGIYTRR